MEQLAVYRHNKYKILVFAIFTVIYVLPLIYFDVFSLLSLISVIAISMFPFTKKIEKEHTNNKMYIYIAVISILTIFVIMYLYINGILDNGIYINNFRVLPSISYLVYIIIPIVWFLKELKINPLTVFYLNKKSLLLTCAICIPIVIRDIAYILNSNFYQYVTLNEEESLYAIYQAFIVAAFLEELFFRGFLYTLLKRIFSFNWSIALSSLVFTLWHFNLLQKLFEGPSLFTVINLIAIFLLGIATACVYDRSKSLLPPLLLHAFIDGGFRYGFVLILTMIS